MSLVVPVAIRAASIWIFSISCFSNCVQLSHIISPYSSKSTYHFFFQCPNYAVTRRRYLSNYLPTLNTNQALYGIADASVIENEVLFSQVQQFIIHSKRFV